MKLEAFVSHESTMKPVEAENAIAQTDAAVEPEGPPVLNRAERRASQRRFRAFRRRAARTRDAIASEEGRGTPSESVLDWIKGTGFRDGDE